MQQIGSVDIDDYKVLKSQLLLMARSYSHVVILDSNPKQNLPATIIPDHYDLIAGFSTLRAQDGQLTNFDDLQYISNNLKTWYLGYLSYDLKNKIEDLSSQNTDNVGWPELHFFIPQVLFLLRNGKLDILSSGANVNVNAIIQELQKPVQQQKTSLPTLKPYLSKPDYLKRVRKIKDHIQRGDIYEMNYCMEFSANAEINPYQVYLQLTEHTPSPFAAFMKINDRYLLSASPERFLKKQGSKLISQPIKGTAPRSGNSSNDLNNKQYLQNSLKERTENIMITDLVRNDLSRIAKKQSVMVDELCGIYGYPHVYQMISTISADIGKVNLKDILKAIFPMGSMTGAPKIAAMQLIERYESMKRGVYSGSVGYIAPGMDFDFNVVIRSLQYNRSNRYVNYIAGSAITALSKAEEEYNECLLKAYAINPKLA